MKDNKIHYEKNKINKIKYNIMKACKIQQKPSLQGNLQFK